MNLRNDFIEKEFQSFVGPTGIVHKKHLDAVQITQVQFSEAPRLSDVLQNLTDWYTEFAAEKGLQVPLRKCLDKDQEYMVFAWYDRSAAIYFNNALLLAEKKMPTDMKYWTMPHETMKVTN